MPSLLHQTELASPAPLVPRSTDDVPAQRLLGFLLLGAVNILTSLVTLLFLHHELKPGLALVCGVIGGGMVPYLLAESWRDLPAIFRRGIAASISIVGVLLCSLATLSLFPPAYWVLRWAEGIALLSSIVMLGLANGAVILTYRRLAVEIEHKEVSLAELRQATLKAQVRALQAQIHPHFLFNTFNALSELIHQDPDAAEEMVEDLASLLRYSLKTSAHDLLPLREEVEAVQRYLALEKARLTGRLRLKMEVDPDVLDARIPGLILQPLVENAIKYAVAPRVEGGVVHVCVGLASDGRVRLMVDDDGPGLPDKILQPSAEPLGTGGHGGGFANVRQRIQLGLGDGAEFRPGASELGGARVEVFVPAASD